MARTTILPNDPNKRKAWAAAVANDAAQEQYFARLVGEEGSRSAVIKKTELEKGAGDEVTTALVAKLRGAPITENQKLAGQEFKLGLFDHRRAGAFLTHQTGEILLLCSVVSYCRCPGFTLVWVIRQNCGPGHVVLLIQHSDALLRAEKPPAEMPGPYKAGSVRRLLSGLPTLTEGLA
jgi:hypothetical protein